VTPRTFVSTGLSLLGLLMALTIVGCGGRPTPEARYVELRQTGDADGLEALANEPELPDPLRGPAREEAARLRAVRINEESSLADIDGTLPKVLGSAQQARLEALRPAAAFRERVESQKADPQAMRAALEQFEAEFPGKAASLKGDAKLNEAVLTQIRNDQPKGLALVAAINLMRPPAPADAQVLDQALTRMLEKQEMTPEFADALTTDLPAWMGAETRRSLRDGAAQKLEEKALSGASTPELLKQLLDRLGPGARGPRGAKLRAEYDRQLAQQLRQEPTLAKAHEYLADPYTTELRAALQPEFGALTGPLNPNTRSRVEQLLARDPAPLLVEPLRQRLAEVARLEALEMERNRLKEALRTPSDEEAWSQIRARGNATGGRPLGLTTAVEHVDKSHVMLEVGGRQLTTLVISRSQGLLLGLSYELAADPPTEAQAVLGVGERVPAEAVGSDSTRGFVLYRLKNPADPMVTERLQSARLGKPIWMNYGNIADIRFNLGPTPGLKQGSAIERKSNELPGCTTVQTFRLLPERTTNMGSGVLYDEAGEAYAMLAKPYDKTRWYALGINEAQQLVDEYMARLIDEATNVGAASVSVATPPQP